MSTMELGFLVLVTLAGFGSGEEEEGSLDTYWSGTAPICMGGCRGKHKELKRSQCGNGSCCWLGYKSFCRGICLRGRIEINERDIDGSCSSTCTDKAHLGAFLNHGCIKISNCVTKQWGWTRWFTRCDFCECDCYVPCSSSG
ncbi:uncharacterized protein LOC120375701 isoform X2 [Mauremys reevesii]|uniref:uncharacterized protein LOC120375701 isoform X2 n=1 Tax=Mauremys reevesii TaxID=260615 RepID=UPI00193FA0BD|nr:uncharacterized protein LOC120375701 isoform X2 [Mauremys reevesii]